MWCQPLPSSGTLEDAAVVDGLWDSSSDCHLSACVEETMEEPRWTVLVVEKGVDPAKCV